MDRWSSRDWERQRRERDRERQKRKRRESKKTKIEEKETEEKKSDNRRKRIKARNKDIDLRRGDESQPRARIFVFPQRNVVVAYAMIEVITPNVLLQSRMNRNPNHLQHLWKTSPCFATLRPPFLSITSHPLANYLVPNPNGRCSPLSFGVPPFSLIFPMFFTIFLRLLSFFSNIFPAVPPLSSVFLLRKLP